MPVSRIRGPKIPVPLKNLLLRSKLSLQDLKPLTYERPLMANILKKLAALSVLITLLLGFQNSAHAADKFPRDKSRKVLSFADSLEPVLPSVVRIGKLNANKEGNAQLSGIGSGAVIDAKNGFIITNAHVVEGGEGYVVSVLDGRVLKAKLIGMDTATDIAVLQADDLRVDAVKIADSDRLRVGDVVFAVGYPLGLEQSLSLGVISGLGRSSSNEGLQDFIQTDAAVNSGNSGGPLLDSRGRLVGINTAIVSRSGGNNGIAFSVPSGLALQVTDQLIKNGEVRHGSIGIAMAKVSETASEKVGINHWDGALVARVLPGSPAEDAGLKADDVIIEFNGKYVKSPHALRAWIGVAVVDQPYKITYIRENGRKEKTEVVVKILKPQLVTNLEQLGAFIRPIDSADNVPSHVKGVYVYKVTEGSPAERAGLVVGDVIAGINNEESSTMVESNRMVSQSKGRARLLVYRFGVAIPIIIEP